MTLHELATRAYQFLGRNDYPSREQMEDYIAKLAGKDASLLTPHQREHVARSAAEFYRRAIEGPPFGEQASKGGGE